jgi:hypothetical protein
MRKLAFVSFSLILFLFLSSLVFAQGASGSLTGVVRDDEGKPLPGVTVTAKDKETGIEAVTTTSAEGYYFITALRPSTYDVTAKLEGFGTSVQEDIVVNVGSRVTTNIILTAKAEERIEVFANPLVETTQSYVGELISEQQISNLPLNGRNFIELAFLTPGNSPGPSYDPTKGRVIEISSAGNLGRGGNIVVDGSDNNDDVVGGVLQNFSEDAIAEFQVLTNRFSAEFGRSASSAINIITKTGTNEVHGSAFLFYRSDSLQADNPLTAGEDPPFDRQQFGGTFGGPIAKDKAFFFASVEYTNEDGAATAATRDVATQTFPTALVGAPIDDLLLTLRADYRLNDTNDIFGRYSLQDNNILEKGFLHFGAPISDPTNFQAAENTLHSGVFGWTRLFASNQVNELRVAEINFFNFIGAEGEPPELVFPSIQIGANFRVPQRTRLNRFQVKDDFTWTSGAHLVKFGGEFQRMDADAIFDLFGSGSVALTEDFATADRNGDGVIDDNDIPVSFALRNNAPGEFPFVPDIDNSFWAFYVQDDWRIRENFTLNLGLRWEWETQTNGANDLNLAERVVFYPDDTGERDDDMNNFGPRLGFAWDLNNDAKTVVRGGYGIYYDRIIIEVELLERLLNAVALPVQAFGESLLEDPFGGGATNIPVGINILSNDQLKNPRVQQFSIGVEHQLFEDLVVAADYVGARGDEFIVGREVNRPRIGVQVNPDINDSVVEAISIANTSYDGLLVSATKRFGRDFQFTGAYTLARAENWANDDQIFFAGQFFDDIADPSKDEGTAEYVDTHRLVLNGTYQLPADFRISGIFTYASGVPFDIRTNQDFLGDGVADRFPLLPRNAGGREVTTGSELNALINEFNTSNDPAIVALRNQCGCTLPLVDPNLEFTDNFINLDLRFSKVFTFNQYSVEPILEIFNVFDTTNIKGSFLNTLAGYSNNIESASFGQALTTAGGVFGAGGPFAIQLAVKFKF